MWGGRGVSRLRDLRCVGNAVGGEVGQVARITTYFYTVTKVVFWAPPLGTGAHKFTPTKGRN